VKFVQLIKLVQQETGMGSAVVRAPRLPLEGAELAQALKVIREAKAKWNPGYAASRASSSSEPASSGSRARSGSRAKALPSP
jgi:hypothetical protein